MRTSNQFLVTVDTQPRISIEGIQPVFGDKIALEATDWITKAQTTQIIWMIALRSKSVRFSCRYETRPKLQIPKECKDDFRMVEDLRFIKRWTLFWKMSREKES